MKQGFKNKAERIAALSDEAGRFHLLALDHESSLRRMLTTTERTPESITNEQLVLTKRAILEGLGNCVSGVLLDPEFSYPACKDVIPTDCGVLLKVEQRWRPAGRSNRERVTSLHAEWTVDRIARSGAAGIKLMIYYRPDGSESVRTQERALAKMVGELCAMYGLVYVLEPVGYPMLDDELIDDKRQATLNLTRRRAMIVLESAREFSKAEYYVDILKLDFPIDLRFVKEYAHLAPENDQYLYSEAEVVKTCVDLGQICSVPWVIMSSGANHAQVVEYTRLAAQAGANGFLCGGGIWEEALQPFPDYAGIQQLAATRGVENVQRLIEALQYGHVYSL